MNVRSLVARDVKLVAPFNRLTGWLRAVRPADLLLPFVLPVVVLVAWQVTASHGWLPVQILPPPAMVLSTLSDLLRDGEIAANLKISLWRISLGFGLGAGAGLVLGALLGVSKTADDYIGPIFKALAQIPSLGWVPVLILIFGLAETLKIVIIAKACLVPTVLATAQAVRNIPRHYIEVAQVLRLSGRTRLFKLLIPATLPTVFSGLRLALSHAWIALIVVEMLAAQEGVGYMMVWGRTLFQIDIVIAGMLVIGVIGLLLDTGLARIARRLNKWAPSHGASHG